MSKKISLDKLIEYYKDINILHYNRIREDLFIKFILFDYTEERWIQNNFGNSFPFDKYSSKIKYKGDNYKEFKSILKEFNKYLKDQISFQDFPKLLSSIYIETFYAFERSVFWFFNYKYNMNYFHFISAEQALYYSKFFAIISIMRFLGCSINRTSYGKFRLKTDWKNDLIRINHFISFGASHKEKYNLFFEQLREFDLKNFKNISYLITNQRFQKKFDWLTSDREEYVYDITSRISNPFKNYNFLKNEEYNKYYEINFLEGYENIPCSSEGYAKYIMGEYEDWDWKEHILGDFWSFLINNLKKIKPAIAYLKVLKNKISYYEGLDKKSIDILFNWLE